MGEGGCIGCINSDGDAMDELLDLEMGDGRHRLALCSEASRVVLMCKENLPTHDKPILI